MRVEGVGFGVEASHVVALEEGEDSRGEAGAERLVWGLGLRIEGLGFGGRELDGLVLVLVRQRTIHK